MEAILSAKEPSEKVHNAAFALLVAMGRKTREGGVVDMSLLDSATANPGDIGARQANIQEFVGMVGASLVAEKDHTVSAGVVALSRVLLSSGVRYIMCSRRK
jgi:ribosomal RNA-processing protein 12